MDSKDHPNTEEIQKDIQDMINKKYGGQVHVFAQEWNPEDSTPKSEDQPVPERPTEKKTFDLNFNYKPRDIKRYLDRYVIEQDDAKKALAIAICDHYNFVRESHENKTNDPNYTKQNILILGPTGVGKTYLVRLIAELIGVPFVKADATRFSETGYVGANVDDLIRDLVTKADGDLDLAQYGIIYLDEADKLAAKAHASGRDVSGRGVQVGLLKLMEETEVDLRASNDMQSQIQTMMEFQRKGKVERKVVNTKHIMFIVSGAFSGLDNIIRERLHRKTIGIKAVIKTEQEEEFEDIFSYASTKDFIEFGFEPEFVGRLPVRVACQHLQAKDLFRILKESEGSIIRQYQKSFNAYNIEVIFSNEGLKEIAEVAYKEKTGARALMTVCEKILRNYKFELPSSTVKGFVVTKEVVNQPEIELNKLLTFPEYHRDLILHEHIHYYEKDFLHSHNMEIIFNDSAIQEICTRVKTEDQRVENFLNELLKSYEYGLNLVKQNTGQNCFTLSDDVIRNPQVTLEKMIKDSYKKESQIETK